MRRRLALAALSLALGIGCAEPPATDLARLIPDSGSVDGWMLVGEPATYGPDRLYDYLDGGAERYLSYGFRRLIHLRYQRGGDAGTGVTIDLFDMGSDLGAFGIYSMARRPESRLEQWGVEGWSERDVAHAWKGSVYLHGLTDDPESSSIDALHRLMARAASQIPGAASPPRVLDPLPVAGRVPRSEQYVAADLMGHSFLPGGVLASYRCDGHDARLAYSDLGSEASAQGAVDRLRDHWLARAAVEGTSSPGGGGFRYADAKLGSGVVVAAGQFVASVHCGAPHLPEDEAQALLTDLVAGLPRAEP
jgi:hypothetical protein